MPFRHSTLVIAAACAACLPGLALASHGWFRWQQQERQQVSVGEWFTFSPQRALFSVTLPAMPTERAKDLESAIKVRTYLLKALSSEYLVVWATGLPDGSSDRHLLDSFFSLALKEMLKLATADGGRFEEQYEKELTLNGNCGRESRMQTWAPNSREIRARGYIVGSDFVALIVLYADEEEPSREAERFFDSLMLVSTGTASPPAEGPELAADLGSNPDVDSAGSVDHDPVPLSPPKPSYTENAKAYKVQGLVRLRVLVNREGDVKEVWLRSHLPDGLDQEAVRSVRAIKFKPATKNGHPVPRWVNLEVDFRLPR